MDLASSLQTLCYKLGIKTFCVSKALEFHERLDTRVNATSLSALRLSGSCKLVICVDLAARNAGINPIVSDVVRISGMSKKSYQEAYQVVCALLDVEERITLRELAVQFGCPKLIPHAADILQRYTKDQCSDIDFGSPMFLCAALFVAARSEGMKVDAKKLRERAGAKKSAYDRLLVELQKYVITSSNIEGRKSSLRKRKGLMDAIDAQIKEDDDQAAKRSKLHETEDEQDSEKLEGVVNFEAWKKKILDNAAKTITKS